MINKDCISCCLLKEIKGKKPKMGNKTKYKILSPHRYKPKHRNYSQMCNQINKKQNGRNNKMHLANSNY
jgi:hypothetical protein